MKCRLALALHRSLDEIDDLSADEWNTWRAFDLLHPIGPDTERKLLAETLRLIYMKVIDTDKSPVPTTIDLLPYLGTRNATLSEVESGAIEVAPRFRRALEQRNG